MLRRKNSQKRVGRRGRRRRYGHETADALRKVWEASDRLYSKRLKPFIGEMVKVMRQHNELAVNASLEAELCRMSPSTIDRLLLPYRRLGSRHPLSITKPGSLLKKSIPIRTFTDWQENRPGFLEADLVAHCGESSEGFYLTTPSMVDVASGWSKCVGVWGKSHQRVGSAVHQPASL